LLRWFGSYGTFAVPQAAAPIAFSLIALPLTGSASSGAAMMLAMTIAQVVGAVPITRFGRRFPPIPFLRALIGLRTLALVGIAVLAGLGAPFPLVVAGAALAGLVNGAAYGNLRAVLNQLVPAAGARRGRHPQRGHLRDLPGARRGAGQHLAAGRRVGDGAAGDGPRAAAAEDRDRHGAGARAAPQPSAPDPDHPAVAGVRRGERRVDLRDRDRCGLARGGLRHAGRLGRAVPRRAV